MKSIIATTLDGFTYLINTQNNQIQCKWKQPQNITSASTVSYNPSQSKFILCDNEKSFTYEYSFIRENVIAKSPILEPLSSIYYLSTSYIVGGTISGKIVVWSNSNGLLLKQFQAHNKKITSIVYCNDNGILITAGEDSVIRGWNFVSLFCNSVPEPLFTYTSHSLPITALYCGEGLNAGIISIALDNTMKCWKIGDSTPTASFTLPSQPLCVCVNSSKTVISVGCIDGKVYSIPVLYAPQFDRINKKQDMQGKVFYHSDCGAVRCVQEYNDTLIVSYQNGNLITFDCETTEPLLVNDEIKSPIIHFQIISPPLHFNSLEDLTIKKSKEWKVDTLILKKYPALVDEILSTPISICPSKPSKYDLQKTIYSSTSHSIDTSTPNNQSEIEKLKMELQRWKTVNSQLIRLLQRTN
ncbi:WD domain, G-beta repeat containing protein [Entamoeba histolytica HM-1:IMSS-B]|uniref:Pre-rRNA-processing protein IPI3 n=7 Tax=Entamoeba histolytica TaxID=5759 RepID=C4LZE5_ENTH1|nr:hypothetical protein EHI_137840 [Entamoeba histolytica HM-1:IMSS]EMD44054.1 pre-rRNA-processing protein IPI3, putative [Entamoeba histolytica KU27]EMH77476.1 WD domain, G-beta repeat containing protein [Entamoeba histolytica HM-1:IMSS-B]EMS13158.1 pre-rRNA-processing protein IPI3, putative [Entamoeba histolytica HM-3:IMSS]ENY65105.1 pre-rRNA-processing protein IPI3, putative [Entamoeba histolytica HM-1:IMSS-A]GAT94232.1 hypothetical protein CL6EHI_137840 [Entamoeba histolytica]|eukprot:XP_654054.2 hypothetical protein EHI_137840 [Entamoeba histolytica HM-1:IMSS]